MSTLKGLLLKVINNEVNWRKYWIMKDFQTYDMHYLVKINNDKIGHHYLLLPAESYIRALKAYGARNAENYNDEQLRKLAIELAEERTIERIEELRDITDSYDPKKSEGYLSLEEYVKKIGINIIKILKEEKTLESIDKKDWQFKWVFPKFGIIGLKNCSAVKISEHHLLMLPSKEDLTDHLSNLKREEWEENPAKLVENIIVSSIRENNIELTSPLARFSEVTEFEKYIEKFSGSK